MANDILKSTLFRDSDFLQNTAVDNKYHVTIGSSGDHVRLIQFYLYKTGTVQDYIDSLDDPFSQTFATAGMLGEYRDKDYDIVTEQVVKFYKSARGIFNISYQSSADGIVGIMTIKEMDTQAQKVAWVANQTSGSPPIPGIVVNDG